MRGVQLAVLVIAVVAGGVAIGWGARGMRSPNGDDATVRRRLVEVCNSTRFMLERLKSAAEGNAPAISDPDRIRAQLDALSFSVAICSSDADEVFRILDRDFAVAPENELKPRLVAMITDMLGLVPSRTPDDPSLARWKP